VTGHHVMAPPHVGLPKVAYGDGVWLVDDRGRRYLDASSGAVAASLGHGNERLAQAIADQAGMVAFAHRIHFRNDPVERLAEGLAALAPGDLDHTILLSSGSEANELAMKAALRHWQERGRPGKQRILSRFGSYHGSTLGALSATGHAGRRLPFLDLLHAYPDVVAPTCSRCPIGLEPSSCAAACLDDLERGILRAGADRVAAFIAEPIVGAGGGVLVPPPGYYERVRALCDRYEVLWIADEVMSGCGRTGRWMASQHWDAVPDMVALGKGISGGYMPLSAVMFSTEVAAAIGQSAAGLAAGHTYSNTPLPAAAGVATLEIMQELGLVDRAARLGPVMSAMLTTCTADVALVGEVRGVGLFWGLDLVADGATMSPYAASLRVSDLVVDAARAHGLIVYPAQGTVDGSLGDAILVAPPLIITEDEIEQLGSRLRAALTDVERLLAT